MRKYIILDKDSPMEHCYRCENDDGYVIDDYTGERVRCEKCGASMLLRYDFEQDRGYMCCTGSYIDTCNNIKDIAIKTPPCKLCGQPTVLRSRGMGGRLFLGCPDCYSKGRRTRIQIGNAIFTDI